MKMLRVLSTIIYLTSVSLLSCTDKTSNPQPPDEYTEFKQQIAASPREDETAELMALYVSGNEVAYQTIYDKYQSALDLVMSQYRDSIPQLDSAGFVYPAEVSRVALVVNESFKTALRANEYVEWDSLNELFDVSDIDTMEMEENSLVDLYFEPRLNSQLVGEKSYSRLSGITNTGYYPVQYDSTMIYPWRIGTVGDTYTFLLRLSTGTGDIYDHSHRFWYFRVADNEAEFVGYHEWSSVSVEPDWWTEAILGVCGRYHTSTHPFCIY